MTKNKINGHFNRFLIFYFIGLGLIVLTLAIALPLMPDRDDYSYIETVDEYGIYHDKVDYEEYRQAEMIWGVLFCVGIGIGVIFLVIGFIFFYILHYIYWELVQKEGVLTTPGKAIGYLFIPFYNLYWIFVSFRGLAIEINKTLKQKNITTEKKASIGLATAFCILMLSCMIPILNFLAYPATQVLLIIMAVNQKKAIVQIIGDKQIKANT